MRIITEIIREKEVIEKSIQKHGFFAEHNYHHFQHAETKHMKNVFFSFDDDMGIMLKKTKNRNWYMFGSVLAPKEKQLAIFMQFIDYIFNEENANKVQIEVLEDFRAKLKKSLKNTQYRDVPLNYVLTWPIYNMDEWDGDKLEGKKWKKIRNLKNIFLADNEVSVVSSKNVDKAKLKQIAKSWVKERAENDKALILDYIKLIESNFEGCDNARTVMVNAEPCSITAGWKIPNTNCYYSAIGLFNYTYKGLGEYCNLDDLIHLKKQGYKYVDFGGSDESLLEFKKKFKPATTYDTFIFSVKRRVQKQPQDIKFKIIKDIEECKKLWDQFSPKNTVWDLWEFNACFFDENASSPYFIVGYKNSTPIGILPLMYDKSDENYGFFGGEFPENRSFYIKDKTKLKHFLKKCPAYTSLYDINNSEKQHHNLKESDPRYFLDLTKFNHNLDAYLATFNKKHRKNLRYDLKQLEKLNYKIVKNRLEDYKTMVELNKQRFGKESDFNDESFVSSMKNLMNLANEKGILSLISIEIDNKVVGVELAVCFNSTYTVLGGGRTQEIKNIGKLLIIGHIKEAITQKADIVDFCTTESGWKELWNLEQGKLVQFVK